MLVKEVVELLLKCIEGKISNYGFKLDRNKKYFKRESSESVQIFDLLFTKKQEGIYVEPTIRIKIKEVEAIYHKVANKDPKYFNGTKTLGNNLFKIGDYIKNGASIDLDEKKSYLIEKEKDVQVLCEVISSNFKEWALPYFEMNSSIAKADELLNSNLTEISIHNWLYPLRANLGIIAAKLNCNPEYDDIVNIYEKEIKEAKNEYKIEFEKLKELLNEF